MDEGSGEVLATQEWLSTLGRQQFAGGNLRSGLLVGADVRLEYEAGAGDWVAPTGATAAGLTFPDRSSVVLHTTETDIVATGPDGAEQLTPLADLQDVPGLWTDLAHNTTVLLPGWDVTDLDTVRIGWPEAGGGTDWAEPFDVARVVTPDGVPVIALVPPPANSGSDALFGEALPDGEVQVVTTTSFLSSSGYHLQVEQQPVPDEPGATRSVVTGVSHEGVALEQLSSKGELTTWRDVDVDGSTLVLAPGTATGWVLAVTERGGRVAAEPAGLYVDGQVFAGATPYLAARGPGDLEIVGLLQGDEQARLEGAVGFWRIIAGEAPGGTTVSHASYFVGDDPSRTALVVAEPGSGMWLLVDASDDTWHVPVAGRVDEDVLWFRSGEDTVTVITWLSDPAQGQAVLSGGAALVESGTLGQDGQAPVLRFDRVRLSSPDATVTQEVLGVDTDLDGRPDLPLGLSAD